MKNLTIISIIFFILFGTAVSSCKKDPNDTDNNPPDNPLSTEFNLTWKDLPEFALDQPGVPYADYIKTVVSTAMLGNNFYSVIQDKFNLYRFVYIPSTEDTVHVITTLPESPDRAKLTPYNANSMLITYTDFGLSTLKMMRYTEGGGAIQLPDVQAGSLLFNNQIFSVASANQQIYAYRQTDDSSYVLHFTGTDWEIMGGSAFAPHSNVWMNVAAGGDKVIAFAYTPPGLPGAGLFLKQWVNNQWQSIPLPALPAFDAFDEYYVDINSNGTQLVLSSKNYASELSNILVYTFATNTWKTHAFPTPTPGIKTFIQNVKFDETNPDRLYAAEINYSQQVSYYNFWGMRCLEGNTWKKSKGDWDIQFNPIIFAGYHPRGSKIYFGWTLSFSSPTGLYYVATRN